MYPLSRGQAEEGKGTSVGAVGANAAALTGQARTVATEHTAPDSRGFQPSKRTVILTLSSGIAAVSAAPGGKGTRIDGYHMVDPRPLWRSGLSMELEHVTVGEDVVPPHLPLASELPGRVDPQSSAYLRRRFHSL